MEALKTKLQQCAGNDAEILSLESKREKGRVVKVLRCKEKGSSTVQQIIVKEETREKAAERRSSC